MVAERALNNPVMLNESSVNVAMTTPPIIGVNDMYTYRQNRKITWWNKTSSNIITGVLYISWNAVKIKYY